MDEMIKHFNDVVSAMSISIKDKMTILGLITAIGYKYQDDCKTYQDIIETDRDEIQWLKKCVNDLPAADVRPAVVCADCKHNNACLTQAFVEDESKMPFDRNTFFCADGKRADDA